MLLEPAYWVFLAGKPIRLLSDLFLGQPILVYITSRVESSIS